MGSETYIDREEISRKVLQSLPLPLFLVNEEHKVLMVNEAFRTKFKTPTDDLVGKSIWDLWPRESFGHVADAYDHVFTNRANVVVEVDSPDNEFVSDLQMSYFGGLAIAVCQDVTERARRERDLVAQLQDQTPSRPQVRQEGSAPSADSMTGLASYERAQQLAAAVFEAASSKAIGFSLIQVEIDTSALAPTTPEAVLQLSKIVKAFCTGHEAPARGKGASFLILCPGIGITAAKRRAASLIERVRNRKSQDEAFTVCIGVASVWTNQCSPQSLFERARLALTTAQDAGTDRMAVWGVDSAKPEQPFAA